MRKGVISKCHGFLCCGLLQITDQNAVRYYFQFLITSHRRVTLSLRPIVRKPHVAAAKTMITLRPVLKLRKSVIIKMSFQHARWLLLCLYAAVLPGKKNILCISIVFPTCFHPPFQGSAAWGTALVSKGGYGPTDTSESWSVLSSGQHRSQTRVRPRSTNDGAAAGERVHRCLRGGVALMDRIPCYGRLF